uniref:Uncharacterized protein n=1 Tax=Solanum tuberosum TaxID=4113 RepID=M1DD03_SOLTU
MTAVPEHNSDNEGYGTAFSEPDDDQLLESRRAEINARSRPDSVRVPTAIPSTTETVPTPTPPVAPIPLVVSPPRLLNKLKADGLRTILEEKLLSTEGLEVPHGKKKDSAFRSVKSVMVRGKEVGYCSVLINVALERATRFEHDYEGLVTT